ncbi:vanadium-dependent haloperoxidase [Flavihumibacter sp. RY-1]|uniref:Vanadium-dependent haloperoxidase n=1 Tax=Flavihumibacter fluminis TaxID=2909236 RepID=A0ABS9BLN4_9BACT|nr:vanadium-dependent haloperoxidase [Flavihumibacter fluminis]MCF1716622.1 vanadium-dependent haloperoxidase [Flavihumibacter fluminis]
MVRHFFLFGFLLLSIAGSTQPSGLKEPTGKNNRAHQWGEVIMTCTANDTDRFRPRPTVTSRFLGLIWTAAYDAWSRYDDKAVPVYLSDVERRPAVERTLKNKELAISYAVYRTALIYFYADSLLLKETMIKMGLNPDNFSVDPGTAIGIGNLAAKQVSEKRARDGSNQLGDAPGSDGMAYADYTAYQPVNTADHLVELARWQPKYFSDGKGGRFAPSCLTPHWGLVKPLLIDSASQFRPGPPPAIGSEQLKNEIRQVVELQSKLTDEHKALVEFMRDGPKSVQQAGHWFMFGQQVSIRDQHTLDQDVQMFFLIEAAAMDAFIACWDAKMQYDFARPYSLVHELYADSIIKLWAGPEKGMIMAQGRHWRPYSPESFLCPPFPSYVSGHSTVSAACAEILRLFKGNDRFGHHVTLIPGALTEPDRAGKPVELFFSTFTETAEMAGISRVMGGYHIQSENTEGLKLGRSIAGAIWHKYRQFTGKK